MWKRLLELKSPRYLICLTIAPAFLSAGIYLCLSRIIVVYGEQLARFKPRTYTIIFVCSDIFALVLQAIGGALADTADSGSSLQQTGINIMIAGLAFQVVSLTIFIALCLDFAWQVRKHNASSRQILRQFHCKPFHFHAFILGKMVTSKARLVRLLLTLCSNRSACYCYRYHICPFLLPCRRIERRF